TLTPVLALRFLKTRQIIEGEEHENWLMARLNRLYRPIFSFALRRKRTAVVLCAGTVVGSLALVPLMGREFMPKLEEGNFWIRATLPLSVSLEQSSKYVGRMRAILLGCPSELPGSCDMAHRSHPEITTVVSQLGRPDDGTDPAGFYNIELFAPLSAPSDWRAGMTKANLTDELASQLGEAFPGVVFNFSPMIPDNLDEAI